MIKYKLNNKIALIIAGIILYTVGASYAAYAAGLVFWGGASTVQTASIQKGLVGHWTLDGDNYNANTGRVTDKTPYENHGTNYGATLTTDRNGQSNGAMSFDGVNNDSIDIPDTEKFPLFSLSAWIYNLSGGDSRHSILTSYWEVVGTQVCFFSYSFANPYWRCSLSDVVPYNQWTHIVTTWDGLIIRHYANGVLVWQDTSNSSGTSQNFNTIAGYSGRKFYGSISDVRVYNRTLSADEVGVLYNSNKPKIVSDSLQKGLVLDMPLTSTWTKTVTAGSQIMTDKTPYSNDGQNYGATVGTSSTSFNGSSNYIGNIASNNSLEPASITVSSWINMDTDASTVRHIWFTKWYGYSSEIEANTRIPYLRLNGPGDIKSNTALTLGEWHHFVGTYDPAIGGRAYLDGNLVGSIGQNGAINHTRDFPLNIGRYYGGIYFKGKIAGAKIYNRALSDIEVKALYDRGR